ncbi:MAG: SRPBCC family protein [Tepidisphaeraceae bacterium]
MSEGNKPAVELPSREIVITREFDAPPALVFKAWIDPKHLAAWWGPKNFTNPVCEVDARIGGAWRIVMRAPDGMEYPCGGVYREIVEPERLVFTNIAVDKEGKPIIDGLTTVTFAENGGGTKLTLKTRGTAMIAYAAAYLSGMEAGWTQSLQRLGEHLSSAGAADNEIVISRIFDAPRELVWRAMTDPKQVIHWWGPRGFTTTIQEMDVRPGGVWKHIMHGPDGTDYPNSSIFREVVKPERIVYSHGGGKKGGPGAHFDATWSFDALNGGGKTRVTIRMVFPSAAERDEIVKEYGAIEGGKQTLERLGEHLMKM